MSFYYPNEIYNADYLPALINAIENELPFSLVRLGDGEYAVMSQEIVLTLDFLINELVPGWANHYGYCGVKLPDLVMRDRMLEAVKKATVVGLFDGEWLITEIFKYINYTPINKVQAFTNLGLPMNIDFVNLLRKYPPLLVGRDAPIYKEYLEDQLKVLFPPTVGLQDVRELDICIENMLKIPHKWSLVSAGACAVVVCSEMAYKYNKVSFDAGHMWDNVMAPDYKEYWLKLE